jgi:hypothetical protein
MLKTLQQSMNTLNDLIEVEKYEASIREYHKLSHRICWSKKKSCEHSIGVRRIYQQSYTFDTGRLSAVKLNSVIELAWPLGSCCD